MIWSWSNDLFVVGQCWPYKSQCLWSPTNRPAAGSERSSDALQGLVRWWWFFALLTIEHMDSNIKHRGLTIKHDGWLWYSDMGLYVIWVIDGYSPWRHWFDQDGWWVPWIPSPSDQFWGLTKKQPEHRILFVQRWCHLWMSHFGRILLSLTMAMFVITLALLTIINHIITIIINQINSIITIIINHH